MAQIPDIPELAEAPLRGENRADHSTLWENFIVSLYPWRTALTALRDYMISLVSQSENEYVFGGDDTGVINAYVITPAEPIASYQAGQGFFFFAETDNDGASTLGVSGIAPVQNIKLEDGSDPSASDISGLTKVMHNGMHYVLLKKVGGGAVADNRVLMTEGANVNTLTFPSAVKPADGVGIDFSVSNSNTGATTIGGVAVSTTEDSTTALVGGELDISVTHTVIPVGTTPDRYYLISTTVQENRADFGAVAAGGNLSAGVDYKLNITAGGKNWDITLDELSGQSAAGIVVVQANFTHTGNPAFGAILYKNGIPISYSPNNYSQVAYLSTATSPVLFALAFPAGGVVTDKYSVYVTSTTNGTMTVSGGKIYMVGDL